MNRIATIFGTASILALSSAAFAEQSLTMGQMDAITAGGAAGTAWSNAIGPTSSTWTGVFTNTQVNTVVVPPQDINGTPTTVYLTQSDVYVGANANAQSGAATGAAAATSNGQSIGNFISTTVSDNPLANQIPPILSPGAATSADVTILQVQSITGNVANAVSYGPPGTPASALSTSAASSALF